jgi:hypothetical protein
MKGGLTILQPFNGTLGSMEAEKDSRLQSNSVRQLYGASNV